MQYCPTCGEPLGNGQKQYDHRCVSLSEIRQAAATLKRNPMSIRGRGAHSGTWVCVDDPELSAMREQIVRVGVKAVRQFGYTDATEETIFEDYCHSAIFLKYLEGDEDDGLSLSPETKLAVEAVKKEVERRRGEP